MWSMARARADLHFTERSDAKSRDVTWRHRHRFRYCVELSVIRAEWLAVFALRCLSVLLFNLISSYIMQSIMNGECLVVGNWIIDCKNWPTFVTNTNTHTQHSA